MMVWHALLVIETLYTNRIILAGTLNGIDVYPSADIMDISYTALYIYYISSLSDAIMRPS